MHGSADSRADADDDPSMGRSLVRFHLRVGWWSLLVFLTLGLILEGMHGLKVDWYLNVAHEVRRLMWTLAHAHGTLLSIIHIAFAAAVSLTPEWNNSSRRLASRCLLASGLLLPTGFLLGGIGIRGGDPSTGILLVPVGGLLLFVSVLTTATGLNSDRQSATSINGRADNAS
jgi:hypothetical protein